MVNILLIFIVSLIFGGIISRTKSILSGRKGPSLFQPIYNIIKLLQKGSVYSKTTSTIFKIAPTIYFSSVVLAILLIPIGKTKGLLSFEADFVAFAYILAIGKFFMIISSLDTGSSFEGMGASREALFSAIVEPAFFILMGSFALFTGQISFSSIFSSLHYSSGITILLICLAVIVLILIAMIENSRLPIDDPKTHLELTMIHEVMILDNSGYDLGLISYTTFLKFAIYGSLIANFFIVNLSQPFVFSIFFLIQFTLAIIVGIIESFMARFRMNHNPQYIFLLSSISLLIFIGILMIMGAIN